VSEPSLPERADHLIDGTLRAHGFATLASMVYLRREPGLRDAVRVRLAQRVDAGELETNGLAGRHALFMPAGALDRVPRAVPRVKLLSPFDNAVIQRDRNLSVHDFDYQLECYVPQTKRRFGYFCLPLLFGDRFVGRADCKAHRREQLLEVVHLHLERPVRDRGVFARGLATELHAFAAFNRCSRVALRRTSPRDLRSALQPALDAASE